MIKFIFSVVFWWVAGSSMADQSVSTGYWNTVAIGGHDTVAYHAAEVRHQHHQIKGVKRFVVTWNGADWWFATQASADRFSSDPERYRPEYNGYCSNALSLGEGLIATDGTVWEFFGDKLHLFYAERGRQRWLHGDWELYRQQADSAWRHLSRD